MKKLLVTVLIFMLLFSIFPNAARIDEIEIDSTLLDGVTMVPLASVAEVMSLHYAVKDGVYSVSDSGNEYKKLSFERGKEGIAKAEYFEGDSLSGVEEITLTRNATYIDGKLYVPYRTLLEFFDARVYWTLEEGAYAYRKNYGREVIIKTDGKVREVISSPTGFDDITYYDGCFLYVREGEIIKRDIKTSMEERLGKAGKIHISGDRLFVMGGGELRTIDLATGKEKVIVKDVKIVGYTADDYAWCETENGTFVYDNGGTLITEIKGQFENSWDYYKEKVYYTDNMGTMMRANTDGTEEEFLIKTALYPKWIENFIYYTDMAGNYRRFNVETKEDIMVYGLNLEHVMTFSDKHILNFYGEDNYRMYISNPDGSDFAPYGGGGVIAGVKPVIYKDGIATVNQVDGRLYYVNEDGAYALTDDEVKTFIGSYDGFLYYTIK